MEAAAAGAGGIQRSEGAEGGGWGRAPADLGLGGVALHGAGVVSVPPLVRPQALSRDAAGVGRCDQRGPRDEASAEWEQGVW